MGCLGSLVACGSGDHQVRVFVSGVGVFVAYSLRVALGVVFLEELVYFELSVFFPFFFHRHSRLI